MLTVGFIGLQSAGKSTLINALAEQRILRSGVRRTTTEACLVGQHNTVCAPNWIATGLKSDDDVEFCALDLPGVCDAEVCDAEAKGALEWAAKCDVVVWVTDASTSFSTAHEVAEYASVRAALNARADEDGTLYQFCIVLAKFDACAGPRASPAEVRYLAGEIRTSGEASTIEGRFERVARMFADTRVVKFSAFARIAERGSEALRALVSHSAALTNGANATFELRWATENVTERRLAQMARVLRDTRVRATTAETRLLEVGATIASMRSELRELSSRVAPSPAYDWPARLVFKNRAGDTVFSLGVMLDRAARQGTTQEPAQAALLETSSPNLMRFGGPVCRGGNGEYFGNFSIDQVTAPLVRPVYGDIFLAPPSVRLVRCSNANVGYEGTRRNLCVYTGRGTDKDATYVLKVGEASRDQLDALLALGLKDGSCVVSIFWI